MVLTYPVRKGGLPRSSLSGFGTCAWSWGKRSRRLNCARPNLLPHVRRNLSQPMNPYLRKHPRLRSLTALRNSRAPLLRMAFPAPLLLRNLMGRSAALPTTRSISRSGVPPRDGSLRVLYAARIGHCRSCPLRAQCQESSTTIKPRRVSAVLWPIDSSPPTCSSTCSDGPPPSPLAPVLWRDWPRCSIRRTWLKVIRSQTLCLENSLQLSPSEALAQTREGVDQSRACALASLLGTALGTQCPSIECPPTGRHAPRATCHLCFFLWL